MQKRYPNLYRNGLYPEYLPGWNKLISDLSERLEEEILKLPEEERENYYAVQVKEKFGGLRFYMGAQTKEMTRLIDQAERKSIKICEKCGKPGRLRKGGWWKTLCDDCEQERKRK